MFQVLLAVAFKYRLLKAKQASVYVYDDVGQTGFKP